MSTSFYEGTGLLTLEKVTPIIKALFQGFALTPDFNDRGDAFIALITESSTPDWDSIKHRLLALASERDISIGGTDEPTIQSILRALIGFFGTGDQDQLDQLTALIENNCFELAPHLKELFLIATACNDGHNLTKICFQGCYRCAKPRLHEFGGNSLFISQRLTLLSDTLAGLCRAVDIHGALLENDLDDAASLIVSEMKRLLAGIAEPVTRAAVQTLVTRHLLQSSSLVS